ncbi:hypothetical protein L1049_028240 [Liquidambar formosana]|uniref:Reticulon-like protein n=1 Tax=Liquidambar formosana TaxID=63359 RepID=A0AAP0WW15_LIQFO
MSIFLYDSDDEIRPLEAKLFGRERTVHAVLGGGAVADVLLWRNRTVSAALLIGITVIWFLFEVVEYNFVTLLCHMVITGMLVVFIWCTAADVFKWTPPKIPEIIMDESTFEAVVSIFHERFSQLLSELLNVACGNDLPLFFLALFSLWILSVIGTCFSFLNLLFVGLLCMETLPFLYERYEEQVEHLAGRMNRRMKKMYSRFDANVLNRIPRGPVKEKKIN